MWRTGEERELLKENILRQCKFSLSDTHILLLLWILACGLCMQHFRANLEQKLAFSKWWLWDNNWHHFSEWFMPLLNGETLHPENKTGRRIMSLALSLTKINWWCTVFIMMKGLGKDTRKKQWPVWGFAFLSCFYHRNWWLLKSIEASFIYVVREYSPYGLIHVQWEILYLASC